jgi:hypothetical protein
MNHVYAVYHEYEEELGCEYSTWHEELAGLFATEALAEQCVAKRSPDICNLNGRYFVRAVTIQTEV